MAWRRSHPPNVDEENPYWMSFSDMMSALLLIFILASVVLIMQLMERQQRFDQRVIQLEKAEQVRRTILEEAEEELRQRGIRVEISENHTVLRISNELLGFESKMYDILPKYQDTAREIGKVLHKVITKEDRKDYLDTVFIEGHTDRQRYQGLMGKGNWGLSTFRAISLWQFWISELPEDHQLEHLTNKDEDKLFSVSGYADTREVDCTKQDDNTAEPCAQNTEDYYRLNRRIDIRFTIRRPTSEEYEAVRDSLSGGRG